MIYAITITEPKGEAIRLELTNPWATGLGVREVEGLGPPKTDIKATDFPTLDGSLVTGTRVTNRQIIFNLIFFDNPPERTIEDCRQLTYKYFPIKKKVSILVETDNRTIEATGWVEENTPSIWSEQEGCTISVVCNDPFLYASALTENAFSGVEPLFEFPFSNESLTENLIEFGSIRTDTNAYMDYIGDSDTGLLISIFARGDAEDVGIYDIAKNQYLKISTDKITMLTGKSFGNMDEIVINTKKGEKSMYLLREGRKINVVAALQKGSTWLTLSPGTNTFYYDAREGAGNLLVTFTWRNAYAGI